MLTLLLTERVQIILEKIRLTLKVRGIISSLSFQNVQSYKISGIILSFVLKAYLPEMSSQIFNTELTWNTLG